MPLVISLGEYDWMEAYPNGTQPRYCLYPHDPALMAADMNGFGGTGTRASGDGIGFGTYTWPTYASHEPFRTYGLGGTHRDGRK